MAKPVNTLSVPKPYWFGSLPDHTLMHELATAARHESGATARLLALLAEVDERRLYAPAGYASLFLYCIGPLHMSEGAAYKRIRVARVARRLPAIFAMVADGRLHLSALVLLSTHLTPGNSDELLSLATHRTKAETEALLARRFPQPDVPTSIQPLVPASVSDPNAARLSPGTVEIAGNPGVPGPASDSPEPASDPATPHASFAPPTRSANVKPLAPGRFALQVTLSQETRVKLRRAQELLGHALPSGDISEVLDRALDALIAQLERKRCSKTDAPRPRRSDANGRYVPAEVRRQVFERDQHQCMFVSEAGKRCDARTRLELDHITPLARGGRTEASNLRLLCQVHNQMQAERVLGRGFMDARRRAPHAPSTIANPPRLRHAHG